MIRAITIPLQPQVTVTDTQHSQAVDLPEEFWTAAAAWQAIKDEEESDRVAAAIQERITELCHPTD